jgi:hypothetical protein
MTATRRTALPNPSTSGARCENAQVDGEIGEAALAAPRDGLLLKDGHPTRPATLIDRLPRAAVAAESAWALLRDHRCGYAQLHRGIEGPAAFAGIDHVRRDAQPERSLQLS